MTKLTKNQKETLRQLATAIEQTVSILKESFERSFQYTKERAYLNQATLLKQFAENN